MRLFQVQMHTFASNCYVLVSEKNNAFVIDPGNQSADIIAALEKEKVTPQYILLTHGHFDHIGAVAAVQKRYDAKIVMNKNDEEQLNGIHSYNRQIQPFAVDLDAREGDTFTVDELTVTVLETPGHTRGGVCYACGEYLFTGDTLFNHDCGRTDLLGGDFPTILTSLERLSKLEKNYKILPGHEESGTLFDQRDFIKNLLRQYR